jgi:putative ABC transport system permease protein
MRNALAVVTLALGIGASTAMFSFVHPMLLYPLLYPHAERLVTIEARYSGEARDSRGARGVSWPEFQDDRRAAVFSDAAAFDIGFFFLTGVEEPEQLAGSLVTPNLFRMLGISPVLGRDFRDGEEGAVILSDACWKRRFGGDPGVLGREIALDFARTPEVEHYTVIGVMPPDFWMYYAAFEVFVPLPRASMTEDRKARNLAAIGRLRDGVTLEQARSVVSAIPLEKDWTTSVSLWEKSQTQDVRPGFLVLAGGAALLFLIATANVAALLLVRAQARQREIAIRAALGASPVRLMRLLIGESLRLGIFAAALGTMLAWWGLRIMVASLPKGGLFSFLPSLDRVGIDLPALGFAIGGSIFASVIAGLFPAFAARRTDLVTGLKDGAAIDSPRTRTVLVAAEIAFSVTLLACAGLLLKTIERIGEIDTGFRSDHLLALRAPVPRGTDLVHAESYYRELTARLAALPGVRSAALSNAQPLTGTHRAERFAIPGRDESEDRPEADYRVVSPGYFATLGIPIHRGRAFDARDEHRAVISESLARKYWNRADPIGQTIRMHGDAIEIIGICGDTRDVLLRNAVPILYRAWRDEPDRAQQVDLRTWADPLTLARAVNGVVRDLGGVVAEVQQGSDFIEDATWQQKQSASVMSAFAGIALTLAAIGLYGVISMAVGRRTREIGIRIAIGARREDVIRLVLAETASPVAIGLAIGLMGALAAGRLLATLLYQVTPSDPVVLAAVAVSITAAAFAASLWPLRRALTIDPNTVLRLD